MVKKLSREQKAWATRKANQLKSSREAATKAGIIKVSENEMPFTPKVPLALCGQLEDAILLLETRISNAIAKVNSLM